MKKETELIKNELTELRSFGIIDYQPQKDSPQICFLRPRIKASDLQIDHRAFEKRKEQYASRVAKMTAYLKEEKQCRSRFIADYFGDNKVKDCGICDNCLAMKSQLLSREEFDAIYHRIVNIIKYESLLSTELLGKLNGIKKEKAWKVLSFLQEENKIEVDSIGRVKLI
jgi:ATP-dependent DNA helicase RecQ